jgi:hypothetical protein
MPRPYVIKYASQSDRRRRKKCSLALTHDPDELISVHDFYVRGTGRYPRRRRPECKKCHIYLRKLDRAEERFRQGRAVLQKHVQLDSRFVKLLQELYDRIGVFSLCDRVGVSTTTYYNWRNGKTTLIKKELAKRLVLVLAQVRMEQQCSTTEAKKRRKAKQVDKWRANFSLTKGA